MTTRQKSIFFIAILLLLAGVEVVLCLYRAHFLLLEKNTIFLYTWDFLHQHIVIPAWEEWKWTGVFQAGGAARYIDAFFAQFYKHVWTVEAVQIPLVALWCFLWHKILCTASSRTALKSRFRYCKPKSKQLPVISEIFVAVALWLYINISSAFPFGAASGALLNAGVLLLFVKAKPSARILIAIVATPLLYFFTGIPAVLIFFIGAIIVSLRAAMSYNRKPRLRANFASAVIIACCVAIPYFVAKPLFLQSIQAAYNAEFFKQFKQKSTNNLYHTNERIEYALYKDDFAKAIELCNKAYEKAAFRKTQQQFYSLLELSHYTKTALLFNGELCDKFLQYYNAPAMQWLFPTKFSNKAMADLFFRLGEYGYARHAAIDEMETQGLSANTAKILNAEPAEDGLQIAMDAQSPPDLVILQLTQNQNQARRDAKAMIYLLFKQIDSAIALFNGEENIALPQYIQEALLIKYDYGGQNPEATQELQKYALSEEIIRKHEQFLQALQAYQYGQISPRQITERFQDTYAFYCFFQTVEYQ
ncbi:MAG: DUF6057 family protein [Bacteroidales bacterium]|jgi:hypothetical protein|nr:DUF6057 family protein [Bacteroidales bacterium]